MWGKASSAEESSDLAASPPVVPHVWNTTFPQLHRGFGSPSSLICLDLYDTARPPRGPSQELDLDLCVPLIICPSLLTSHAEKELLNDHCPDNPLALEKGSIPLNGLIVLIPSPDLRPAHSFNISQSPSTQDLPVPGQGSFQIE